MFSRGNISGIGESTEVGNKTRSLGMKKIVSVLNKRGPKRIIGVGGFGINDTQNIQYA